MSNVYGIDIGTSNFKMCCKDKDAILNEKNIIAMLNAVSANQPEMESSEGFTIYLVSNVSVSVDENGEKVYDYSGTDDVAFSDGKELRELLAKCEQGKYIETECSEVALLIKKVQENNMSQTSEAKTSNKAELKAELLKKKQILMKTKITVQLMIKIQLLQIKKFL